MSSRNAIRLTFALPFFLLPLEVQTQPVRFAVIGDYGKASQPELDVSNLVKSWNPDFVITTGDNNYEYGEASTIDANIGQYYHEFISPYVGSYGTGDTVNRFFPSLGNHDWNTNPPTPYYDYFTLPGNERYYDFVRGPVHFFCIDSDPHEPDGNTSTSMQATWLRNQLIASTSRWKIVYFHHAPYSSGTIHGNYPPMQWQFQQWGANVVLAGHEHTYERIIRDSLVYFVVGNSGKSLYPFGTPIAGSMVRYNSNFGAQLIEAYDDSVVFRFFNRNDSLVDFYKLVVPPLPPTLKEPENESTDLPITPILRWNSVPLATTYQLQVSASPMFTALIVDDSLLTDTLRQIGPLLGSTTYHWRVRAQNGGGTSDFSLAWNFTTVYIEPPDTLTIDVHRGWNLLSLPVKPTDPQKTSLFPNSISRAFEFNGTAYSPVDTLENGTGFWLRFAADTSIVLFGDSLHTDTIDVLNGWNMIGTIALPVATAGIVQLPNRIVESSYFGYRGRYETADTLKPGKGYWVKARQSGQLVLGQTGVLVRE